MPLTFGNKVGQLRGTLATPVVDEVQPIDGRPVVRIVKTIALANREATTQNVTLYRRISATERFRITPVEKILTNSAFYFGVDGEIIYLTVGQSIEAEAAANPTGDGIDFSSDFVDES